MLCHRHILRLERLVSGRRHELVVGLHFRDGDSASVDDYLGSLDFTETSYGKAVLAIPQTLKEVTPFQEEEARLESFIDSRGQSATMFSPGGMVQIGHEKFHAESDGVLIEAGQDVVVVGVKGNRLIVMAAEQYDSIAQSASSPKTAAANEQTNADTHHLGSELPDGAGDDPIDFDIPETV